MRRGIRGGVAIRRAAIEGGDGGGDSAAASATSSSKHEEGGNGGAAASGTSGDSEGGGDCPYSAAKEAVSSIMPGLRKKPIPEGGPPMLPSDVFLKSIIKAGSSNVGMPEAMLEWVALTGHETIGIKNMIGPLCISTVDPDIVEYICHTNAKNYRLRMLPDAFRYVIKNKGITGSDGKYNREHRVMCQKPFMNSFSLERFSQTVEERVGLLLDAWDTAAAREGGQLAVDIDDHSQRLTLDIVTLLAFAKDFKQARGPQSLRLYDQTNKAYQAIICYLLVALTPPIPCTSYVILYTLSLIRTPHTLVPCTSCVIPYTAYSTPYTPHPIPYTPHPNPTPHTLNPTPHILHPTPHTLYPTPHILHPTPHILYLTPHILTPHPTP